MSASPDILRDFSALQSDVARLSEANVELANRLMTVKQERDEAKTLLKVADQSLHASLYREGELKKELNNLREAYNDLIGSDRPPLVKKAEIL